MTSIYTRLSNRSVGGYNSLLTVTLNRFLDGLNRDKFQVVDKNTGVFQGLPGDDEFVVPSPETIPLKVAGLDPFVNRGP